MKATQGSFEVTAISKVTDINQWGEYKISSCEEISLLYISDAIKLKIHRSNAVKQNYSLDDLRDLESKLALITGKYAAGKGKTRELDDLHYLKWEFALMNDKDPAQKGKTGIRDELVEKLTSIIKKYAAGKVETDVKVGILDDLIDLENRLALITDKPAAQNVEIEEFNDLRDLKSKLALMISKLKIDKFLNVGIHLST